MNYEQIHKALKDEGLSWAAVGEASGCTYQHVMNVCSRRVESPRIAKAIALLIHKDVAKVFPDKPRYTEDKKADRQSKVSDAKARLIEAGLAAA